MELIKIENGIVVPSEQLVNDILELKKMEEKVKVLKDTLNTYLLEEMQKKNIKGLETPEMVVSYVDEYERETFDSKTFRKDYPDMYDEYVKFTTVKPSVRIKAK